MKRFIAPALLVLTLFVSPMAVIAQTVSDTPLVSGNPDPLTTPAPSSAVIAQYSNLILTIVNTILVPLLFTVAFIVFLWGVFNYFILGGADEEKRKSGREFVRWGLIGFAVMISLWGLVNVLVASFGLGGVTHLPYPTL